MILNVENGYEAYAMAPFTRVLGMSHEEAENMCRDAFKATCNIKDYHAYGH